MTTKVHIAVLMMVKNETKRIGVTLESIKNFADSLVVYDTGSTDDTITIIQEFAKTNRIPLRLKQGEFVNFCESRNVSLEFADAFPDIEYILLMDCNDELRFGDNLRKLAVQYKTSPSTAFLVCQEWWSGQYNKYYNVRFIKAREGWRYKGRVHEWFKNTKFPIDAEAPPVPKVDASNCTLYQDRTKDDDKTGRRFGRDKELLLHDFQDNHKDPRTVFYLAQTCSCLYQTGEAFYYYKLRSAMGDFQEEVFSSLLRCGELSQTLFHPWHESMGWYIKAYECIPRVEPLINIAEYYRQQKNWMLAFTFIDLACKLTYPDHLILFIDAYAYTYKRWHLLGIIGYYAGQFIEGRIGCEKAIETGLQLEVDQKNLTFYDALKINPTIKQEGPTGFENYKHHSVNTNERVKTPDTKKEFIDTYVKNIMEQNSNANIKQAQTRAKAQWKLRERKE